MSDAERAFVRQAESYEGAELIFADWLDEQGRCAEAEALRDRSGESGFSDDGGYGYGYGDGYGYGHGHGDSDSGNGGGGGYGFGGGDGDGSGYGGSGDGSSGTSGGGVQS
jgi:uncharacterized protein (TIGR02996 family)